MCVCVCVWLNVPITSALPPLSIQNTPAGTIPTIGLVIVVLTNHNVTVYTVHNYNVSILTPGAKP